MKRGRLFAFDQDADATKNSEKLFKSDIAAIDNFFIFVHANFRYLRRFLNYHGVEKVDGILADLGVSSYQIDTAERGFSTRFDGMLDMRMDRSGKMGDGRWKSEVTAEKIVNEYPVERLHKIFGMYGEIRNAKTLAEIIIKERHNKPIKTTADLKNATSSCIRKGKEHKYLAQVFQALRIEVNDELTALKEMLVQAPSVLKKGGKIAITSYHSLEDRLVKNFFKKGKFYGEADKDIYGNENVPFSPINKKPIIPSEDEVKNNNRARSAKLRIAVRL